MPAIFDLKNIGSEYMINGNNRFRIFIYSHTKEKLEDLKQEKSAKTEVKKVFLILLREKKSRSEFQSKQPWQLGIKDKSLE